MLKILFYIFSFLQDDLLNDFEARLNKTSTDWLYQQNNHQKLLQYTKTGDFKAVQTGFMYSFKNLEFFLAYPW